MPYTVDTTTSQTFDTSGDMEEGFDPGEFAVEFFSGTGSEHDKVVSHVGSSTFTATQDGDGQLASGEFRLLLDLQQCTFTFVARASLEVSNGQPGTFTVTLGAVQGAGPHSLTAFTDRLSGSQSFPAHSDNWAVTHADEDAYIVGGLGSSWFLNPDLEDEGGTAQVTWDFEPDPPLTSATARPDSEKQ